MFSKAVSLFTHHHQDGAVVLDPHDAAQFTEPPPKPTTLSHISTNLTPSSRLAVVGSGMAPSKTTACIEASSKVPRTGSNLPDEAMNESVTRSGLLQPIVRRASGSVRSDPAPTRISRGMSMEESPMPPCVCVLARSIITRARCRRSVAGRPSVTEPEEIFFSTCFVDGSLSPSAPSACATGDTTFSTWPSRRFAST